MTDFKRIFLDEDVNFGDKTRKIFDTTIKSGSKMFTSAVTYEEYLVYPYKTNNIGKIEAFKDFIRVCNISIQNIDSNIADKAARIRAEYKDFKAMDALQLASAEICRCNIFLTNDKQLKQYKNLKCLTIDDFYL